MGSCSSRSPLCSSTWGRSTRWIASLPTSPPRPASPPSCACPRSATTPLLSTPSVVTEALPDLSRPSMQQINEGNPVSLNMVNEYTDLYTKDKLQLVPQERPWGFTETAEVINGRIAMAAITGAVALSVDPTLKALVAMYRAAKMSEA